MALNQLRSAWGLSSIWAKIGLGVAAVILMLIGHFISARLNLFHDSKFDSGIQEKLRQADKKAGEVDQLTTQIQNLGNQVAEKAKEAQDHEKREADLVQQVMLYKTAAEAGNRRSADAVSKLADEDKRYAEEVSQQSSVSLSACDRWLANCKRAIRLLKGFKGPCNCDQIEAAK